MTAILIKTRLQISRFRYLSLESTGENPLFTQHLERYVFLSNNSAQTFTTKWLGVDDVHQQNLAVESNYFFQ